MSDKKVGFLLSLITYHLSLVTMEPEISHRCRSCGASIRVGAQFCHQCGGALDKPAKPVTVAPDSPKVSKRKKRERGLHFVQPAFKPDLSELPFTGKQSGGDQAPLTTEDKASVVVTEAVEATGGSQTTRQRVRHAAREMVADNVLPRVEKLRHASSVVLEEAAAIDPSVRFVLIALFLFVVFIVLLVLSFI